MRNATAITDTDRLDFLEQTQQGLFTVHTSKRHYYTSAEGKLSITHELDGWCVGSNAGSHPTPREAIDAAIVLHNHSS